MENRKLLLKCTESWALDLTSRLDGEYNWGQILNSKSLIEQ